MSDWASSFSIVREEGRGCLEANHHKLPIAFSVSLDFGQVKVSGTANQSVYVDHLQLVFKSLNAYRTVGLPSMFKRTTIPRPQHPSPLVEVSPMT